MTDAGYGLRAQRLNEVFGGLRAEYFRDDIFDLFAEPTYWPELQTRRPCLLVGGRGTGKTTVLRGLSYEGQSRLTGREIDTWNHVGLYWRVDTNSVRAFRGSSLTEDQWIRVFGHYLNIVLAQSIVDFLSWVEASGQPPVALDQVDLARFSRSINVSPQSAEADSLANALDDALVDFEVAVNNIDANELPTLSVLGRPISFLCRALASDARMAGKRIFFLVDEYENFEDYQQRSFNTLIKHAGDEVFTFKIGMKAMGHRERATINPDEILVEPADYALVDIAERLKAGDFKDFAARVCMGRLERIASDLGEVKHIEKLLPSLTEEGEAELLGVQAPNVLTRKTLAELGASKDELLAYDAMSPLESYMVRFWATGQSTDCLTVLREALSRSAEWTNRLTNYQHAALYTIRRRRSGISKYYAGWDTFVHLADGNIRYLLQLVNEALQDHLTDTRSLETPVSYQIQTKAAQAVGQRLVEQLQGLSAQGADLTRLVLGLGRVFQVMAADPEGHTPEVSQFRVRTGQGEPYDSFSEDVLTAAVMHLAVRTFPGDKMALTSGETRETHYQLHPIFAPFFVFSYRSKRRMDINSKEIYGLVRQPSDAIRSLLSRSRRDVPDSLPEQMSLFQDYFG